MPPLLAVCAIVSGACVGEIKDLEQQTATDASSVPASAGSGGAHSAGGSGTTSGSATSVGGQSSVGSGGSGGSPATLCKPGETKTVACNAKGNDELYVCNKDGSTFTLDKTVYGCTATADPGKGTRVCPGKTFTRSCWPIAGGRARVDWTCQGNSDAQKSKFVEADQDYCTATSGPESGQHFCPGEVLERNKCPTSRSYFICPDTQAKDAAFVSHATLSCTAEAKEWEPLHRGLELMRWTESGHRLRVLRANLCDASLRVAATAYADRGKTTTSWATGAGMLAAVNGGFFLSGYAPDGGVAFGAKKEWPTSGDTNYRSFIAFGRNASGLSLDVAVEKPPYPNQPWMEEAVCGDATLVFNGNAIAVPGTSVRARTGAGFSADGKTLYLLTVDENNSKGMTVAQFASTMATLGVDRAINLDGGGSTTIWARSLGRVNVPTAGTERIVANHLGIYIEGGSSGYNCPLK